MTPIESKNNFPLPRRLCHNRANAVIAILKEVNKIIVSIESIIEILRLGPQNDIATESHGGKEDLSGNWNWVIVISCC